MRRQSFRLSLALTVAAVAACSDDQHLDARVANTEAALLGTGDCPPGTNVISGTSASETLIGTPGPDCILGKNGDDTIYGGGGDDFIAGGKG
jgi:Ca2+-binding RTX toxin-like protein